MSNRPALLLIILFICVLIPGAQAWAKTPKRPTTYHDQIKTLEPPTWQAPTITAQVGQQTLVAGRVFELLNANTLATAAYMSAATMLPSLRDFIHIKAAQSYLDANAPMALGLWLGTTDALHKTIPGAGLIQARTIAKLRPDRKLDMTAMTRALTHGPRQDACTWLINYAAITPKSTLSTIQTKHPKDAKAIINLLHGRCFADKYASPVPQFAKHITPQARLMRAERLFRKVRFYFTKAELDKINVSALNTAERCQYLFRRARTYYRIRKLRKQSTAFYLQAIAQCKSQPLLRRRSLYSAGKYLYQINKSADAAKQYKLLLKDYPKTRYTDDALYYLAKIARRNKDTPRAQRLLKRALRDAPDGDMIFEMVWEAHEDKLRNKQCPAFIKTINTLKLPKSDSNYFSQGRLGYFIGWCHEQLKQKRSANKHYRKVFNAYPFSFYGYMSWAKLKKQRLKPTIQAKTPNALPQSWFPKSWGKTDQALLYHAGLKLWAAQLEARKQPKTPTREDLWRQALLYDRADKPAISHNIARRRIDGRPWAQPVDGRVARWAVAWPNPFAEFMHKSHHAEQKQHKSERVSQALPLAIMREESSFIPTIESYAGALGLMQLMPATALNHDKDIKGRATPPKLRKANINIRVGVDHIFLLARRLKQHPVLMVSAYNAGAGAVRRWLRKSTTTDIALFVEDIPSFQTRNYTKRVIGSYFAYQWLLKQKNIDTRILNSATLPKKK